ncbi:MAG: (2Fe-2S)-binding protein, partial [Thermoplasmata archaeon]
TEGEIVEALHRPFVSGTIDGIKRRVRAGMGRCQGGFCGPRVVSIISRELGIDVLDVCKSGLGSNILVGRTKTCCKEKINEEMDGKKEERRGEERGIG